MMDSIKTFQSNTNLQENIYFEQIQIISLQNRGKVKPRDLENFVLKEIKIGGQTRITSKINEFKENKLTPKLKLQKPKSHHIKFSRRSPKSSLAVNNLKISAFAKKAKSSQKFK